MDQKELMKFWLEEGTVNVSKLLLTHYTRLNLTETELVLLLQLNRFIEKGIHFPTPEEISDTMTISAAECARILRKLVQMQYIAIEEGEKPGYERYSLQPLWEKFLDVLLMEKRKEELQKTWDHEQDLYSCFEQEFGRPLSPLECETLAIWIDQDGHTPVMIKAALREAVISGKLNFRYIDRILFEWKKQGIQSIDQAREYSQRFRQGKQQTAQPKKSHKAVLFIIGWRNKHVFSSLPIFKTVKKRA